MSKEIKNVDTTAEANNMVPENPEVKKEGFMAKGKNLVRKHGKKVAIAAGVAGLTFLAYALGRKGADEDVEVDDYEEVDVGDVTELSSSEEDAI